MSELKIRIRRPYGQQEQFDPGAEMATWDMYHTSCDMGLVTAEKLYKDYDRLRLVCQGCGWQAKVSLYRPHNENRAAIRRFAIRRKTESLIADDLLDELLGLFTLSSPSGARRITLSPVTEEADE